MPSYKWDHIHKIYSKQCSRCGQVTDGVCDKDESIKIFLKSFAFSGPSSGMADGMQSRCNHCNTRSYRDLAVTRQDLEQMWEQQGGKCIICCDGISLVKGSKNRANLDHDASTGEIRALLCGNCNRGIGLLRHNPENLIRARDYILKHRKVIPIRRRI